MLTLQNIFCQPWEAPIASLTHCMKVRILTANSVQVKLHFRKLQKFQMYSHLGVIFTSDFSFSHLRFLAHYKRRAFLSLLPGFAALVRLNDCSQSNHVSDDCPAMLNLPGAVWQSIPGLWKNDEGRLKSLRFVFPFLTSSPTCIVPSSLWGFHVHQWLFTIVIVTPVWQAVF